ncbi:MAG: universal stress protein [Planctomycetota bacterium]
MRQIVLATDGSEMAENAADFLARVYQDERLRITVVSVLNEAPHYDDTPHDWARRDHEKRRKALEASFDRIRGLFEGSSAELDHRICAGHTGKSIVACAEKLCADLIVVGAKGHSTLSRVLLGSTSDFVATHAACSVLVVRPQDDRRSGAPRIALAYDGSRQAKDMLNEFRETSWSPSAETRIVTVVPTVLGPFGRVEPDQDEIESVRRQAEEGWELIDEESPCNIELIKHEHVADGLVESVERDQTDILFVGESPEPLNHFWLGSIAKFVLRHSTCSVWIARTSSKGTQGFSMSASQGSAANA